MDQPKVELMQSKNGLRVARNRQHALTSLQRKTLENLAQGMTFKQAAITAGYSESAAARGYRAIFGGTNIERSEHLRDALRAIFCAEEFADRIRAGCDATETRFFPTKSQKVKGFTDKGQPAEVEIHDPPRQIDIVAWETRRRYMELLTQLAGLNEPPKDSAGEAQLIQIQALYEAGPVLDVEASNE